MNVCFIKQFAHLSLLTLATSQALALLTPAELWKLQGLRFSLQTKLLDGTCLPDGATLAADAPEKKILDELGISVGEVPCVEEWAKGFSPLIGALAWNNGLINKLYFYGPASKFEEITDGAGCEQYVLSKKGDPFIDLVRYLFYAPEGSHELNVSAYNSEALRAIVELPHFGAIVRLQLANQEISSEQLAQIKGTFTGSKNTRKCLAETMMMLGEKIKQAKTSQVFPRSFVGFVLSAAWYRVVQSDQLDAELKNAAVMRLPAWDENLKRLIDSFGARTDLHERTVSLEKYVLDDATARDNKTIAVLTFLSFIPYPPIVKQGWRVTCKFDRKVTFADCGENTLHNLFDFLVYDPQNPRQYQFSKYLLAAGLKSLPALQNFYVEHSTVSESANKSICQEWADLVTGVPGVSYGRMVGPDGNRGGCDLTPSPNVMLKVIRYLLGVPEPKTKGPDEPIAGAPTDIEMTGPSAGPVLCKWADLQNLLSIPGVRSIRVDDNGEKVKITIDEAGIERWVELRMNLGHAEAVFPAAIKSLPCSVSDAITEANARLLLGGYRYVGNASIYALPLDDSMPEFDMLVATLLDSQDAATRAAFLDSVSHWFGAAATKWLEIPDDSPRRILKIAWYQVVRHGALEKEAHALLEVVKNNPQLHKAYLAAIAGETKPEYGQIFARIQIIPRESWRLLFQAFDEQDGKNAAITIALSAFADVSSVIKWVRGNGFDSGFVYRSFMNAIEQNVPTERLIRLLEVLPDQAFEGHDLPVQLALSTNDALSNFAIRWIEQHDNDKYYSTVARFLVPAANTTSAEKIIRVIEALPDCRYLADACAKLSLLSASRLSRYAGEWIEKHPRANPIVSDDAAYKIFSDAVAQKMSTTDIVNLCRSLPLDALGLNVRMMFLLLSDEKTCDTMSELAWRWIWQHPDPYAVNKAFSQAITRDIPVEKFTSKFFSLPPEVVGPVCVEAALLSTNAELNDWSLKWIRHYSTTTHYDRGLMVNLLVKAFQRGATERMVNVVEALPQPMIREILEGFVRESPNAELQVFARRLLEKKYS